MEDLRPLHWSCTTLRTAHKVHETVTSGRKPKSSCECMCVPLHGGINVWHLKRVVGESVAEPALLHHERRAKRKKNQQKTKKLNCLKYKLASAIHPRANSTHPEALPAVQTHTFMHKCVWSLSSNVDRA